MTDTATRFYHGQPGTSAGNLYGAIPADTTAIVRNIRATNTTSNEATLTISTGSTGVDTAASRVLAATEIAANGNLDWSGFLVVPEGEYITGKQGTSAAITVAISGVLVSSVVAVPEAFNVMDYGATGDGTTDDTVAFEDTRDAAGEGGVVYVPPGTYIVNDVTLDVDHQDWKFAGGAVIKLKNSATGEDSCFDVRGDYIAIEGGEWDGNRANNTGTNVGVIQARGANHFRIRGIYCHDAQYFGVRCFPTATGTAMNDIEVSGSTFIDCVDAGVYVSYGAVGTPTTPSRGARIISCYYENSAVAAATITGCGFVIAGETTVVANMARGCVISDCVVRSRADATTECAGILMRYVYGGEITGCHTENLSFEGHAVIASQNVVVSGCVDRGSVTYGFELAGESGALVSAAVTGCYSDGNEVTETGIVVNCANDVTISGNVVRNLLDAANSNGIAVVNPSDVAATGRITIVGNTIQSTDTGIRNTDGKGQHILIADNTIFGPDSGGYGVLVDWTNNVSASMRNVIRDNLISDFVYGVRLINGNQVKTYSDVTVRDNSFISIATASKITTDANITWDSTCVIRDDTDIPDVASAAGNITLPFADTVQLTGTSAVTSITASYPGRRVTLINASSASLTDGSNLKLSANGPNTADDSITLVCNGTNWYEVARSAN